MGPGYRERVALLGRIGLVVCIAPALFFVWRAIGLPASPAMHFSPTAPTDTGLVVQIAHPPQAAVRAAALRLRPTRGARATSSLDVKAASAASAAAPASSASPASAQPRALAPPTAPPVTNAPAPTPPEPTPQTEPPQTPEVTAPVPVAPSDAPPAAQAAATVDVTLTVQPPALPVQLPPVSISVALPQLPLVPALPGVHLPGVP
jgi:hypothetical protein